MITKEGNKLMTGKRAVLRVFAAVLAAVIIMATLTGCGTSGEKSGQGEDVISGKSGAETTETGDGSEAGGEDEGRDAAGGEDEGRDAAGGEDEGRDAAGGEDEGGYVVDGETGGETDGDVIKAIDFAVYGLDGKKINLSDNFGKPIVLNFWATWCGPCRNELPHFQAAYEKYGEKLQFMMVEVSAGLAGVKDVEDFLEKGNFSFPTFLDGDGEASINYGINSIPVTLFIDKDGNITDGYTGMLDAEKLAIGIEQILD